MQNYYELISAVEYIEAHLLEPDCTQVNIAKAACVSLSTLQKRFRYAFGYSVGEYILKRKMTVAAEELRQSTIPIAHLAQKYGYQSTEAFSRAFCKVNCCLPSDYRKGRSAQAVFSALTIQEDGIARESSTLLAAIHQAADCYVLCFTVAEMAGMRAMAREVGELALMQMVQRIRRYATETMQLFRIGREEFVLITLFQNIDDAERLMDSILAHNGEPFQWKGQAVPLYLRGWYGRNTLATQTANPAKALREQLSQPYQEHTEENGQIL